MFGVGRWRRVDKVSKPLPFFLSSSSIRSREAELDVFFFLRSAAALPSPADSFSSLPAVATDPSPQVSPSSTGSLVVEPSLSPALQLSPSIGSTSLLLSSSQLPSKPQARPVPDDRTLVVKVSSSLPSLRSLHSPPLTRLSSSRAFLEAHHL